MRLGTYTFPWEPDKMTIPEENKSIAEVSTYQGSAIFLWDSVIQGSQVILEWDWMSIAQYTELRDKYLAGAVLEFDPDTGGTVYNVVITSFLGQYFKTLLHDVAYRENVKMILSIRSIVP